MKAIYNAGQEVKDEKLNRKVKLVLQILLYGTAGLRQFLQNWFESSRSVSIYKQLKKIIKSINSTYLIIRRTSTY